LIVICLLFDYCLLIINKIKWKNKKWRKLPSNKYNLYNYLHIRNTDIDSKVIKKKQKNTDIDNEEIEEKKITLKDLCPEEKELFFF